MFPPRPSASVDNILLDLLNSSHPTQPHSMIANYFYNYDHYDDDDDDDDDDYYYYYYY